MKPTRQCYLAVQTIFKRVILLVILISVTWQFVVYAGPKYWSHRKNCRLYERIGEKASPAATELYLTYYILLCIWNHNNIINNLDTRIGNGRDIMQFPSVIVCCSDLLYPESFPDCSQFILFKQKIYWITVFFSLFPLPNLPSHF